LFHHGRRKEETEEDDEKDISQMTKRINQSDLAKFQDMPTDVRQWL
jgi:hypothetical protein